jgi:hypothetical protein
MIHERSMEVAGVAGLASVVLGSVAGVVDQMWRFPTTTSTAAEIAAFVDAHRTSLLAAMVLNTAAVSLMLVFGAGVWLRLRHAAGTESLLSACFAVGLVSFLALIFAGFTSFVLLVYRAPDVAGARLLYDAAFGLLAMSGAPTAVALGAYAALVFRAGHLPRWTAFLGALAAFAHVVLLASFVVREGFFSLEGAVIILIPATLFIWIAGTSIAMLGVLRRHARGGGRRGEPGQGLGRDRRR